MVKTGETLIKGIFKDNKSIVNDPNDLYDLIRSTAGGKFYSTSLGESRWQSPFTKDLSFKRKHTFEAPLEFMQ